jgi:hypothetical protein
MGDIDDDYDAFYGGIRQVASTRIMQETPIWQTGLFCLGNCWCSIC